MLSFSTQPELIRQLRNTERKCAPIFQVKRMIQRQIIVFFLQMRALLALLEVHIVDIAPTPVFAPLSGLDDRVLGRMKMCAGVAIFRRVAAPYMPALQAHTDMKPGIAGLEAFFAALGVRFNRFDVVGNMGTGGSRHSWLRSRFRGWFNRKRVGRYSVQYLLLGPVFAAFDGAVPAFSASFGFSGIHPGFKTGIALACGSKRIRRGPEAGSQTGKVSRAKRGGFCDLGPDDRHAEHVGLELHEQVVDGRAAVDAQRAKGLAGFGVNGLKNIGHLEGDAFEGGAGDVAGTGVAAQSDEQAGGVRVPMGRAESNERRDEDHPAGVGLEGGERFHFSRGANEAQVIAQPLHHGTADEDAAFERVFQPLLGRGSDGGNELVA